MRKSKHVLMALALGASMSSGCIYVTVTPSVQGKAFIAQKKLIGGGSFWNCDATSGTPTCWQVKNVPNGPVSAGGGGGDGGGGGGSSEPAAAEPAASEEKASE
jgi:hypothetical protein